MLIGYAQFTSAQVIIVGRVMDSLTQKALSPVRIENVTTHQGVSSKEDGSFSITCAEGEYLLFTHVGYKNVILKVKANMDLVQQRILMTFKPVDLKEITIKKGLTEYQKDSLSRASLYKDAFDYKQTVSVMSPVTSVYQAVSKKHRAMRKFQDQIVDMEAQKFIDTRYTLELVRSLTKLDEEQAWAFMKACPMEYDYARGASDLEIKMWIKFKYQEYLKTKKDKGSSLSEEK